MGADRISTKVSDHLGCIYDLLNNLQTQLNNEIQNRKTDVNDARSKANTAQATANRKVDSSTYEKHTHLVSMNDNQTFWAADSSGGKTTKRINVISAKASTIGTGGPQ